MKYIIFFFFLCLTTTFFAQHRHHPEENNSEILLNNNIKEIKIFKYIHNSKDSILISDSSYDFDGKLITRTYVDRENALLTKIFYQYNSFDKMQSRKNLNLIDSTYSITNYKYDNSNRIIEEKTITNKIVTNHFKYEYNKKGNKYKFLKKDQGSDSLYPSSTYYLNKENKISKTSQKIKLRVGDVKYITTTYKYDKSGNHTKRYTSFGDGSKLNFENIFNNNNQKIKTIFYRPRFTTSSRNINEIGRGSATTRKPKKLKSTSIGRFGDRKKTTINYEYNLDGLLSRQKTYNDKEVKIVLKYFYLKYN